MTEIEEIIKDAPPPIKRLPYEAQVAWAQRRLDALNRATPEKVVAERTRRLSLGFDYNFNDARGIHHIGTTNNDMIGWDEVTKLAGALVAVGVSTPIQIVTDTGPVEITPLEWQSILLAAGNFRQPIWKCSFLLQSMSPIPEDYTDDKYWSLSYWTP